jgi:tetratricopeptide (TPR) repeat protein
MERALAAIAFDCRDDAEGLLSEIEERDRSKTFWEQPTRKARAALAARSGRPAEAMASLLEMIDDPEAQLMLGYLYLKTGDARAALKRADWAAWVSPGLASTEILRARSLYLLGRLRDAVEAYSRAVGCVSNGYEIYMERAEVHLGLNDPIGAIEDYVSAARCEPTLSEPYARMARLLMVANALPHARELVEGAMAGPAGRTPPLLETLAEVCIAARDLAAAIVALDELADGVESRPDADKRLAELYAAAGHFDRAQRHLDRVSAQS